MHSLKYLLLGLHVLSSQANSVIPIENFGAPGIDATYDYVVVGGGTSGLTIAARLAETSGATVAVLEAGGLYEVEAPLLSVIPGLAAAVNTGTSPDDDSLLIDWNFDTVPQTGANNRVLRYARGKCLGGSSGRNFMVYHRGTKGTFDKWAELIGDTAWSWASVLPFFKKSTTLTPPDMSKRQSNASIFYDPVGFDNSLNGPLQVTWPNHGSPLSTYVEVGLASIGLLPDTDLNTGTLNGSSWASVTVNPKDQSRESSETSFLDQALGNSKLKVYQHAFAKQILFSGTTATGVKVDTFGVGYTIKAKKEVIVSAGAFQSPQLLMVSGIGPQATLQSKGISVLKDLPGVGQNLMDHFLFGITYRVNVVTATRLLLDLVSAADALTQYLAQKGPLTAPGFGVIGYEKLPASANLSNSSRAALDAAFPSDWPDVEYIGIDGIMNGWKNADDQKVDDGYNYGGISAALVAPLSRGSITINSSKMEDPPLIDLGYLTHPADAEVAVAAFKRTRQAWAGTDITLGDEYLPGPAMDTDASILEYIRETLVPVWHPSGTCKMGASSDPEAVVDSNGRVHGVKNLRVVDASIFPVLPPGHPQSACYMVAEKIAQDIKDGN
ncbi:alcohol oxidase [Eremomyces bilateralis CBS 781.70]|uniref:Alcohol oxidase n=1 Tax=Eremomyces bilateralis CBS 781.70 TaxID=1392243 RepID=A0A6G1G6N2_9PEZI|nr:alcohol oxidase [Eremomyces bilateralis CBS 781.70]KAF1813682.1 alcohol oxidase [Eremomyces bilateralis CBS 781.70]